MSLFWMLALPFLGSLGVAALPRGARAAAAWLAGAVALAAAAILLAHAPDVFAGGVGRWALPWLPLPGADFGLRLDGLAFLFALLVLGIGALVVLYAAYYLDPADPAPRFYAFLLAFMGAMLGVVLADNLILLVVFWELTSLASFLLIGYWKDRAEARQGARMALAVTGLGGLALLGGVLLLGQAAGSFKLDVVLAAREAVQASPLYLPALLLILLGAFTKSAQFPFHFWLPHAMAAPTPVSAYLHSATMVKAGVFLLARLYPVLAGSEAWFIAVSATGVLTLLIAAFLAVFQHDLKGLLAYSTISHLGLITLLFGLNTPLAAVAATFHILNHATFKASLFMAAGIIDHECGTRDMRRINGLWKYMPWTSALGIAAAAAMAGVPLLNGFLSKEMFFAESLRVGQHPVLDTLTPLAATLAGAFGVAYSMRFVHDVFFNGEPHNLPRTPHEPPRWMRLPVELLVLICIGVGIVPALAVGPILALAAGAVLGGPLPEYSLAIWHGLNWPLAMSLAATALGVAFYFALQKLYGLHDRAHFHRGGKEIFDWIVAAARSGADRLTRYTGGGLQWMLLLTLLAALGLGVWAFLAFGGGPAPGPGRPATPAEIAVALLGAAAVAATVVLHRRRFLALLPLGLAGLVVSLAFVWFSAPDLALTQLLVEFVTVILMMLALHWLPGESPPEPGIARRLRDGLVAVAAGAGIAAAAYAVMVRPSPSYADFFLRESVPRGGGSNVVNVIIVDFRGFDTLGEIAVLGIAALAIHALLAGFRPAAPAAAPGGRRSEMLRTVAALLLPIATLVAVFLFLRGHNLPGGGFIAGLVFAVAVLVLYVARGWRWTEARLALRYEAWIGLGLLAAGFTGIGSLFVGHPFLTSAFGHPVLPAVGEVPIASAMFFDLGVFMTVVGATLMALSAIGRLGPPVKDDEL
ncbi:MAG TPA: monovalent cation/H+ antiporter subunit A [Rhodocyclaceae bacterium]|nr:monovalent cation/H+ antiporter subunit A [Rhodocyclaceae bacterium]